MVSLDGIEDKAAPLFLSICGIYETSLSVPKGVHEPTRQASSTLHSIFINFSCEPVRRMRTAVVWFLPTLRNSSALSSRKESGDIFAVEMRVTDMTNIYYAGGCLKISQFLRHKDKSCSCFLRIDEFGVYLRNELF